MSTLPNFDDLNLDPNSEIGQDVAEYEPSVSKMLPPPTGRYVVVGKPDTIKWGRTKDSQLYMTATFLIQGGNCDGRFVNAFVSAKESPFRKGSDMEDLAYALGKKPESGRPTIKDLTEMIADNWGRPVKVFVDWEGYCEDCGKTVLRGTKTKEGKDGKTYYGYTNGPVADCPICGATTVAKPKATRFYVS
jgi:hypothetical protein